MKENEIKATFSKMGETAHWKVFAVKGNFETARLLFRLEEDSDDLTNKEVDELMQNFVDRFTELAMVKKAGA